MSLGFRQPFMALSAKWCFSGSAAPGAVVAREIGAFAAGLKRVLGSAFAGIGLAIMLLVGMAPEAMAQCTSVGTGNWTANATWTTCGGVTPTTSTEAIISSGGTVTVNATGLGALDLSAAVGSTGILDLAKTLTLGTGLNTGTGSYGGPGTRSCAC